MFDFGNVFQNKILIASLISCLVAQVLKIFFHRIINKEWDVTRCIGSGGMPSSHSSSVCTLATCIGMECGFASPIFAVVVVFSLIVMYDASGVRKETGEQAKILNKIIKKFEKQEFHIDQELKELIGHTKPEVWVGAGLGILIGILFY